MSQEELLARINNDFRFHPANASTGPQHDRLRDLCGALAVSLVRTVPEGRELSLALTNLEQVMFWANAAIARNS